jgi:hypothetical protein
MRKVFMASAFALVGLAAAPAQAMPFAPLTDAPGVTLAAYGCGPGWTRGPYGGCHPMGYGVGRPAYRYGYGYHPYHRYGYGYRPYHRYGYRVYR